MVLKELRVKVEGPMKLLCDNKVASNIAQIQKLLCDNKAASNIAHNPVKYDMTKHVEIDRQLIKEKLENILICMPFVPLSLQLADMLTKGLHRLEFEDSVCKPGLKYLYSPV